MFPAGRQGGGRAILLVLTIFFNVLPVSILGCSWVQLVAKRENQLPEVTGILKLLNSNHNIEHYG